MAGNKMGIDMTESKTTYSIEEHPYYNLLGALKGLRRKAP